MASIQKTTAKITLDLYAKNVVSVAAKQYDDETRYIEITCVENGVIFTVDKTIMSAFIRLKKPDDKGVFNEVEITSDGKLKIELTEQMLSASGRAIADVFLLRKVFTSEEKPTNIDDIYKVNAPIISIMDFYINITPTALNHSQIESSYEFNALTNALAQIDFNNKKVVELDKTLTANENVRNNNEVIRQDNEQNRVKAENTRISNEQQRITSENTRKSNEDTRISNEDKRNSNEDTRMSNENERKSNESQRQTNESNRVSSETQRAASESNRQSNESNRQTNENARQANESTRQQNESNRQTKENERISNENTRINAENERIKNENIRISNENTRKNQETQRQNDTATAIANANNAAKNANDKATDLQNKLDNHHFVLTNELQDSVSSTSTIYAPTANAVKTAYDKAASVENTINSNKNNWSDKYTKNEIDNKFSALENNIDWKESVATFDDIEKTYPNAEDGWTVNVKDTDYTYRYSGSKWVAISANAIPKATQTIDGLLSKEDKINYDDANAKKHTHSNKSVLDGITSTLVDKWNKVTDKLDKTGDASNVTNTLTTAATRTNLTTGEKLSASLGKISKWFSDLKPVSFTGSYNDLNDKPAINNGTITIKQAGSNKGTFTLNQSGDTTIELTDNDTTYSNATTSTAGLMSPDDKTVLNNLKTGVVTGVKGNSETTYRTGNVNLTPEDIGAVSVEDFNNLQIGGRNLLTNSTLINFTQTDTTNWQVVNFNNVHNLNTTTPNGIYFTTSTDGVQNSNGVGCYISRKASGLKTGDIVTFSADVKGIIGTPEYANMTYWSTTPDSTNFWTRREYGDNLNAKGVNEDTYTRCSITVTLQDLNSSNNYDYFGIVGSYNSEIWFKNVKLEKGSKATDYSLAIEDTADALSKAQNVLDRANNGEFNGASSWTPVTSSTIQKQGSSFIKRLDTADGWNAQIYSYEGFETGAYVIASPATTNGHAVIGLNDEPAADTLSTSIKYAIYFDNGTLRLYEYGQSIESTSFGTYTPDTIAKIIWDGETVSYYKDNTLLRTTTRTAKTPLYLDSSIHDKGVGFKNITFGPIAKGDNGVGISDIHPQYYLSTSNTTQTGGSWSDSKPTWVACRYYWTRDYMLWTNGNVTYSTPQLATDLNDLWNKLTTTNSTVANHSSNITQLQNNIDELKISGTNLLKNSGGNLILSSAGGYRMDVTHETTTDFPSGDIAVIKCTTAGSGFYINGNGYNTNGKIKNGDTITISGYVYNSVDKGDLSINVEFGANHTWKHRPKFHPAWEYFEVTVTATKNVTPSTSAVAITFYMGYSVGEVSKLSSIKVEKGNKATRWSPAPEDYLLYLSGGTLTGKILRYGGGSWISDRNNVAVFGANSTTGNYNCVVGQKTVNGAWTIGNLGGNENLVFNYSTDSNVSSNTNSTSQIYLPNVSGTIITSASISSQSVKYATSTNISEHVYSVDANGTKRSMTFNWKSADKKQPTYLFGSEDGSNVYVYNPSNFQVAYASSAGDSNKLQGYSGATSAIKSTYVLRDTNNYIYTYYINSSTNKNENASISQIITTNDTYNFYRKSSLAQLKMALGNMPAASGSDYYMKVYNSNSVGQNSSVSVNDLAKQGFAAAMIHSSTDNPVGAAKWIHAINLGWQLNNSNNWNSQIALGVENSDGMYYRTTQGNMVGAAWKRVLDSSNYKNYCTPANIGAIGYGKKTKTDTSTTMPSKNQESFIELSLGSTTYSLLIGYGAMKMAELESLSSGEYLGGIGYPTEYIQKPFFHVEAFYEHEGVGTKEFFDLSSYQPVVDSTYTNFRTSTFYFKPKSNSLLPSYFEWFIIGIIKKS